MAVCRLSGCSTGAVGRSSTSLTEGVALLNCALTFVPLAPLQATSASTDLLALINRNLRGDEPVLQTILYSGFAARAVRACMHRALYSGLQIRSTCMQQLHPAFARVPRPSERTTAWQPGAWPVLGRLLSHGADYLLLGISPQLRAGGAQLAEPPHHLPQPGAPQLGPERGGPVEQSVRARHGGEPCRLARGAGRTAAPGGCSEVLSSVAVVMPA